ncbi:MAG: LysE family transporter [Roseibium sp.]|nr:LysE family transporter [Roseibium sp.]
MEQLPEYLPGILLAYSAFLLGIASPGPNVLAVIGTSMSAGRPSGIALALGVATGSLSWALLTVLGLSALLATYSAALAMIKIVGGCYLIWLAFKSFRSAASSKDLAVKTLAGNTRSHAGYFWRGYLIQMTNPKAALTWIAIVSLGLQDGAPLWVGFVIVLGTFILSILAHTLYALAFSTPAMVRLYGHARRKIQVLLGGFFAFAGARLLTSSS